MTSVPETRRQIAVLAKLAAHHAERGVQINTSIQALAATLVRRKQDRPRASPVSRKLTADQEAAVLHDLEHTNMSQTEIATKHGTTQPRVSEVWTRRPT